MRLLNQNVLLLIAAVACSAHTASIVLRIDQEDQRICDIALEVVARGASEFGMESTIPMGSTPTILPDGSVVLAEYGARGTAASLSGYRHTVYLTVFAETDCREVSVAITDYDASEATEYVTRLRRRLVQLLGEHALAAKVSITDSTVRTLPP